MKIFKNTLLLSIFFLAIFVRLFYFPFDLNFAYDQARDAFVSQRILSGDLITVGPPTTFQGIHHGALFYYFFAPIYWIAGGSPLLLAAILRILNALGVFLVFLIAKNLFSKKAGYLSSFIYAVSFEQTQLSLFLAHPSPAVLIILFFFWGLSELIFNDKQWGILVASFSLGLSTQFHFSMFVYFLVFSIYIIYFYKSFLKINSKYIFGSLSLLVFAVFSFVVAELKFGFNNSKSSVKFFESVFLKAGGIHIWSPIVATGRYVRHNIYNFSFNDPNIALALLLAFLFSLLIFKKQRKKLLFLGIWFSLSLISFAADDPVIPRYVNAMGNSVAIIIFASFLITKFNNNILIILSLVLISYSNLNLIFKYNKFGTIPEVNAQNNNLLDHQKALIDYIYNSSEGKGFSVNAVTIPYNINTTWSYLFEWYGQSKYGYIPVWAGKPADGFEGKLEYISARSEGPELHFLVIEPKRGITPGLVRKAIKEENIFTYIIEEKQFGKIVVQKRLKH